MARSTFKTLFYINRSKQKKNGRCPIMGRITIDGQQVQYSMGLDINPNNWDTKHGRWKSHTNLTHPGKYFRPSKVKIMRPTSPK